MRNRRFVMEQLPPPAQLAGRFSVEWKRGDKVRGVDMLDHDWQRVVDGTMTLEDFWQRQLKPALDLMRDGK